ncbi:monooxygenase [Paenibacillus sp. J53TS2]|jgi:flavin reductase (DIM6/NTAB) family NADH-FMN oxidoreductase RutF|uniref:flavin reductase family protein n=1 Tax=Paenibacillus sp. J53TS2 TaxID=2807197 RepID=UPI000FB2E754|nr:flavin reductase family protein [Paenibacillus sp. J53TS2]GIP49095.1 monooxygenase [Paenibacillus sp. J53TS2]
MDPMVWRNTMGQFATGVTVITTLDQEGNPLGMTANAFTSLSLDPPMVLICVDRHSATLTELAATGKYCVNILEKSQESISRQFAKKGGNEKFLGIAYHAGETGLPVLEGCLTSVECVVEDVLEGGDHLVLLGRGLHIHTPEGAAEPLLFYRGKYAALDKAGA